jgi:hypothetical protein
VADHQHVGVGVELKQLLGQIQRNHTSTAGTRRGGGGAREGGHHQGGLMRGGGQKGGGSSKSSLARSSAITPALCGCGRGEGGGGQGGRQQRDISLVVVLPWMQKPA